MNDQLMRELGERFARADRKLFLVGGSVRDLLLAKTPKDFDFTTDALPKEIQGILRDWADAVWDVGARFGTIAAQKDGFEIEITTMRHDGPGRKPEVVFTDDIIEDLVRRDFTINAMAMQVDAEGLHQGVSDVIDPFNGRTDLFLDLLKTPAEPWKTFTEDPLRMMRAARFAAQLDFKVGDTESLSILSNRELIKSVSAERIAAELDKIVAAQHSFKGWSALLHSRILEIILPEFIGAPVAWVASTDINVRWADTLITAGVKPDQVPAIGKRLKWSNERRQSVTNLVTWVERFALVQDWSWTEVRRVVAAAGPQLDGLLALLDDDILKGRVETLLATEGHPKPLLTGKEILLALGVKPGPVVGRAQQFLWDVRLREGNISKHHAALLLKDWAADKVIV
ncbi:tRNA nucleotransferase [Mycobacterium phage Myrna]|uniref:tRNA nucleotransferase n=1 Tax=Mycobacterium phage Myrna TaxID=546805 RepID=B5LJ39_9CAUD|nr:tRNA nucleotidyltransferase [Mycobacterium phage Myrna]ACH62036.1 tRNA nucleotransferase [Mycobacterium phage Myrna]